MWRVPGPLNFFWFRPLCWLLWASSFGSFLILLVMICFIPVDMFANISITCVGSDLLYSFWYVCKYQYYLRFSFLFYVDLDIQISNCVLLTPQCFTCKLFLYRVTPVASGDVQRFLQTKLQVNNANGQWIELNFIINNKSLNYQLTLRNGY